MCIPFGDGRKGLEASRAYSPILTPEASLAGSGLQGFRALEL